MAASRMAAAEGPLSFNGDIVTHPNLYVRNLPPNMDQTAVEVLFRRFGPCTGCKFFKTAAIPYAFLRLSTPAEALAAIKALNGTTVSGRLILVKPADSDATYDTPNENLYVRNIPVSWDEKGIREFFEKFGPTVSVRVLPPLSTSVGQVAMVRFHNLDHAQAAREGANAIIPPGESLPLNVKFADNQDEKARKLQSRMVKAGSIGGAASPGGPGMHRYAPYPGASAPPSFGMPPLGMPMDSGELLPFGPPGIPGMPPPPPWAADPAVMLGVPPPPPPPPPRHQHQPPQQGMSQHAQLLPPQQHLPQQQQPPPVVGITVDVGTGQFMVPQPGAPGLVRPPQPQPAPVGSQPPPQQPQQFPPPHQQAAVVLAPTQPPGLQPQPMPPGLQPTAQQPRPALQQPAQPHVQQPVQQTQPKPAPQPQPGPGHMPHPLAAAPPYSGPGAQSQGQPYAGQPGAQQPQSQGQIGGPPPGAATGNAAAPGPYPGYDSQAAQHYGQQPYPGAPYAYPGYSHDPYAQAAGAGHTAPYDAQTAAYYAAYYGHPQQAYGQPPAPGGAPGHPPAAGHSASQPADPYQAYQAYYYQYYGAMAQQGQQPAQPQQQVPQANGGAVAPGSAAATLSAAPTAGASAPTAGAAAPQMQQGAAPWQQPAQQQPTAAAHITAAAGQQPPPAQGAAASVAAAQPAATNTNVRLAGAGAGLGSNVNPTIGSSVTGATAATTGVAPSGAATANGSSAIPGFKPKCRVMVQNLPDDIEKLHLYESFSPYGAVLAVHVQGGFAVVMFSEPDSATRAAAGMNGALVKGARVKVILSET